MKNIKFEELKFIVKTCKESIKGVDIKRLRKSAKDVNNINNNTKLIILLTFLLIIILFADLYIKNYIVDLIIIIALCIGYFLLKRKGGGE